jgi:hypothetical protein
MSTRINVNIGDGGLLDRNAQQQAAARQANQQRASADKAAVEGQRQLEQERIRKGLDPATGRPLAIPPSSASTGSSSRIRRIDQEPAANRTTSEPTIGAYQYSLQVTKRTQQSTFIETIDTSAEFALASASGSTVRVFRYPSPQFTLNSNNNQVLPTVVGNNSDCVTIALTSLAPSGSSSGGSNQSVAVDQFRDNSAVYTVPAGNKAAYIVLYLNYAFAYRKISKSIPSTTSYTQVTSQIIDEQAGKIWVTNPNQSDLSFRPLQGFWIAEKTFTTSISIVAEHLVSKNECKVFYVKDEIIQEITEPPETLLTLLRELNPPVGLVPSSIAEILFERITNTWDGSHSIGINVDPVCSLVPAIERPVTQVPTTVPGNPPNPVNFDSRLLYFLGGLNMLDTSESINAYGPSLALTLLNGLPNLSPNDPRALSYAYMENVYYQKSPKAYVSSCVLPTTCTITSSGLQITWSKTRKRPETVSDFLIASDFKPVQKGVVSLNFVSAPSDFFLSTRLGVVFYTDWGDPDLCLSIARRLVLSS